MDTSLHWDDPEFASPGFVLAGDDLLRPPVSAAAAEQQPQVEGIQVVKVKVKVKVKVVNLYSASPRTRL